MKKFINEKILMESLYLPLYMTLISNCIRKTNVCLHNFSCTLQNVNNGLLDFSPIRKSPEKYIAKEHEWYLSQERNIEQVKDVQIWQRVCSNEGKINSNYGWCVFSPENTRDKKMSQFDFALEALLFDKETRQSIIFYNRPEMHEDSKEDGMSDFMCTFYIQFYIDNNKLHMINCMRSNDAWFGLFSDLPWACYVQSEMLKAYNERRAGHEQQLHLGSIHWNVGNIHMYEMHYDKLRALCETHPLSSIAQGGL